MVLVLQREEIGFRVESTVRDRLVPLLVNRATSVRGEITLVPSSESARLDRSIGLKCAAHLVRDRARLLLDHELMMGPGQDVLRYVMILFARYKRRSVLVVHSVVDHIFLFSGLVSLDLLVEDRPYWLVVLAAVFVESLRCHVEVLYLQVFYSVAKSPILVAQLNQLCINVIHSLGLFELPCVVFVVSAKFAEFGV